MVKASPQRLFHVCEGQQPDLRRDRSPPRALERLRHDAHSLQADGQSNEIAPENHEAFTRTSYTFARGDPRILGRYVHLLDRDDRERACREHG
jgi:hypothetical protein